MEISSRNVKNRTLWISVTAVFLGLNILLSSYGMPVPGGHMYLNDIVICLAALLLDPLAAAIAGGVGAFLGDFFFYPTPMYVSLVTHGLQALVISLIAHGAFKKKRWAAGAAGVAVGAVIMVVGYTLGRAYIYSTPEYAIMKLPYQILQAAVGAIVGWVLVYPLKLGKIFNRTTGLYVSGK